MTALRACVVLLMWSGSVLVTGCLEDVEAHAVAVRADAGPDQLTGIGEPVALDGRASTLSPLVYWISDGDGVNEDRLMQYDSRTGITPRTLRDSLNGPLGWPGDMVFVDGELLGVATWTRRIVLVVPGSGSIRYLTDPLPTGQIMGLAYDTRERRLLAVDATHRTLLAVDLHASDITVLCTTGLVELTGVAYSEEDGRILVSDKPSRSIYRVDPDTAAVELVVGLPGDGDDFIDEIAFFQGALYCTVTCREDDIDVVQLHRFDSTAKCLVPLGPPIPESDGHTLVMRSVPQNVTWEQEQGPSAAVLLRSDSLTPSVQADRPGEYTFRLTIAGSPTSDTVQVSVR